TQMPLRPAAPSASRRSERMRSPVQDLTALASRQSADYCIPDAFSGILRFAIPMEFLRKDLAEKSAIRIALFYSVSRRISRLHLPPSMAHARRLTTVSADQR